MESASGLKIVTEFAPLIANRRYCKGSLIPTTLEEAAGNSTTCTPLPPIHEQAFSSDTKSLLATALKDNIVSEYENF